MVIYADDTTLFCNMNNNVDQARQTRPNSGGVAEGHARFDKGGVAIILAFYTLKIELFSSFYATRLKIAYF